jgi:hypothetical protein
MARPPLDPNGPSRVHSIRITLDDLKHIRAEAAAADRTTSAQVRHIIRQHIARRLPAADRYSGAAR